MRILLLIILIIIGGFLGAAIGLWICPKETDSLHATAGSVLAHLAFYVIPGFVIGCFVFFRSFKKILRKKLKTE